MKITECGLIALFYCQRYGVLTAQQLATIESVSRSTSRQFFVSLGSFFGSFGNVGLTGRGKAPKAFYITRQGYEALKKERELSEEIIERFRQSKGSSNWSKKVLHRLDTVSVLLNIEKSSFNYGRFEVLKTFTEYRRERIKTI